MKLRQRTGDHKTLMTLGNTCPKRKVTKKGKGYSTPLISFSLWLHFPVSPLPPHPPQGRRTDFGWPAEPGGVEAQPLLPPFSWESSGNPLIASFFYTTRQEKRPTVDQRRLTLWFRIRKPFIATYYSPPIWLLSRKKLMFWSLPV